MLRSTAPTKRTLRYRRDRRDRISSREAASSPSVHSYRYAAPLERSDTGDLSLSPLPLSEEDPSLLKEHSSPGLSDRRGIAGGLGEIASALIERCQNGKRAGVFVADGERAEEFLSDLESNLERARLRWSAKIEEVVSGHLHLDDSSVRLPVSLLYPEPSELVMALFSYEEDVFQMLEACYDRDDGAALMFYVPQLITFLFYREGGDATVLENFILNKCSRNISFAHRCFWFLRAWCLDHGIERVGSEVNLYREDQPLMNQTRRTLSMNFEPEDHQIIEHLVDRLKLAAEEPAWQLNLKWKRSDDGSIRDGSGSCDSTFNLQEEDIAHKFVKEEAVELFHATPRFLDALTTVADDLMDVPRGGRTAALQVRLAALGAELLPSNVVYVPLGTCGHRVVRIVADESFAISTKERCPCIIYLEVIDDGTEVGRGSSRQVHRLSRWWKERRVPQRHNTIVDKVQKLTSRTLKLLDESELMKLTKKGSSSSEFRRLADNLDLAVNDVASDDDRLDCAEDEIGVFDDMFQKRSNGTPPKMLQMNRPTFGRLSRSSSEPSESPRDPTTPMGQWSMHNSDTISPARKKKKGTAEQYGATNGDIPEIPSLPTLDFGSTSEKPLVVFKEQFSQKTERLRKQSIFGHEKNWRLVPILVKSNDDLRQEQLTSQVIHSMATILARKKVPVWLCPYEIVALSRRGGIMQAVPDTISIDSLKRNDPSFSTLKVFFDEHFGPIGSDTHSGAKANFIESLAAYSIVCYLLQIKDRHNGNILLTREGHIVHIDFGFLLLSSPGGGLGFERAPFKLTTDFVELMDGPHSRSFARFRDLCVKTFMALRGDCHRITMLVEMLATGNEDLGCFCGRADEAVVGLRERFRPDIIDGACADFVNVLVDESLENWRTRWYDRYQRCCVGIL